MTTHLPELHLLTYAPRLTTEIDDSSLNSRKFVYCQKQAFCLLSTAVPHLFTRITKGSVNRIPITDRKVAYINHVTILLKGFLLEMLVKKYQLELVR